MIDKGIAFLAPHLCTGCGLEGGLLCIHCKYDIISEPFVACLSCGGLVSNMGEICRKCKVYYLQGWCIADRRDQLERLINGFKFTNTKGAFRPLAELLDSCLPDLPPNTVVVPIPTVSSHIRQRGYDHMLLIARQLGKMRNLPVRTDLQRATSSKQRDASRAERIAQAKEAFACRAYLDPSKIYLIVDDVVTTGATVNYAAKTLKDAGAVTVWVASISRQPVD